MRILMSLQGTQQVRYNMNELRAVVTRQGNLNAWNAAQHLFARSRAVVPYDTSALYHSAFMEKEDTGEKIAAWVVGYDTIAVHYAMIVHETPDRFHPTRGPSREPKQDHYLSEPRDAMVKSFPQTVAQDMERAIKGARLVRR